MSLVNFITWLTVGTIIGWFAHRMVEFENRKVLSLVREEEEDLEEETHREW